MHLMIVNNFIFGIGIIHYSMRSFFSENKLYLEYIMTMRNDIPIIYLFIIEAIVIGVMIYYGVYFLISQLNFGVLSQLCV